MGILEGVGDSIGTAFSAGAGVKAGVDGGGDGGREVEAGDEEDRLATGEAGGETGMTKLETGG